jgi:GAF domain-containing protein
VNGNGDGNGDDRLYAAVAAGVLRADDAHRALIRSIVEVAKAIFGARASSIFLFDEEADELVFEAVAGEGEESLVGMRFPSSTGVAGWVLTTRQPIVVEDAETDPRFAREAAEATGYVPRGLMAAPLLVDDRVLGVLEVLDRPQAPLTLDEMGLLGLFASQAVIALDLLQHARRARSILLSEHGEEVVLARLAHSVNAVEGAERESRLRLLRSLDEVLAVR